MSLPIPLVVVRPLAPQDWLSLAEVLGQSFNAAPMGWDVFRDRLGDENFRVVWEGDRMVGGCGVYPMGQVWGGKSVPLGGVAGVGVAPDARGRGVAKALMIDVLRWLHERGVPVAGLYPATQRVYRAAGYEQSGERLQYQAPLASLAGFRQEVDVIQVEPLDVRVRALIAARYRPVHGNLDRSEAIWARLTQPTVGRRYAWLLGDDGYVILQHQPPDGYPNWDVDVLDLHAPTAPAGRSLLALLASHRSTAKNVRWYAGPSDPLLALFPEPTWSVAQAQRWMLRIVDFAAAVAARGWPVGVRGEVHLSIDDPLLSHNHGDFVLTVEGGVATLRPGGQGDVRLSARALGPLYSGYFSASTLVSLGLAEGRPSALAVADRLFASPTPWMREMY